jgi:hypothetical protein
MKTLTLPVLLAFVVVLPQSYAQEQSDAFPKGVPIVYGKKHDGMPLKLKMRGVISEVSPAWIYCGVLATAGTIKVQLTDNIEGYPHKSVYLVLPCFGEDKAKAEAKYLNRALNVEVQKLYAPGKPCYFEVMLNQINSHGVPFYCLKDWQNVLERSARDTKVKSGS